MNGYDINLFNILSFSILTSRYSVDHSNCLKIFYIKQPEIEYFQFAFEKLREIILYL